MRRDLLAVISFLASRAPATFGIPLNPLDFCMSIVGTVCGSFSSWQMEPAQRLSDWREFPLYSLNALCLQYQVLPSKMKSVRDKAFISQADLRLPNMQIS